LIAVAALLALLPAGAISAKSPSKSSAATSSTSSSSKTSGAVERYTLRGDAIAIHNLAGALSIEPGSGSETVIEVTRGGSDGHMLRIETGTIEGETSLRVIYPEDEIVYPELGRGSRTTLEVAADGRIVRRSKSRDLDTRRVEIKGSGPGLEAHADIRVLLPAGRTLRVALAVGPLHAGRVTGTLDLEVMAGSIDANGVHGDLEASTGSGSVAATDHVGDLSITTGSGDVRMKTARGGSISAETGSGSVEADRVEAKSFAVSTGSGRIELGSVRAPQVAVSTGSGGVEVDFGADIDDVEISTGSGSVTVQVPRGFGAQVDASCGSGHIESSVPMEVSKRKNHSLEGSFGDGKGSLRVDTGSGTIRFEPRPRSGAQLNLGAGVFMQAVE